MWPASATKDDIQVLSVVGPTGFLDQWGFDGDFYGAVYWSDPKGQITFKWGPNAKLHGAMILDTAKTDPANTKINTNGGVVEMNLDTDVFDDIAKNQPGVLQQPAAVLPAGVTNKAVTRTVGVVSTTPYVRLVTSKVSFTSTAIYR